MFGNYDAFMHFANFLIWKYNYRGVIIPNIQQLGFMLLCNTHKLLNCLSPVKDDWFCFWCASPASIAYYIFIEPFIKCLTGIFKRKKRPNYSRDRYSTYHWCSSGY